jgi:hypothetical protein
MQLECGRHRLVDGLQELAKLDCSMPLMQLADHGASFEVERREQVGRAVAQIVRRAPLGLAGTHRQHWLAAVERLNLRLFIHAQDQRAVGRVEVSPTMSRNFSMNSGSLESLKPSVRWGCSANARQMRLTMV